ncbi:adenine deaminase [Peijinzhouia sedimentorum]
MQIEGQIIDIEAKRIYPGVIYIDKGKIKRIEEREVENKQYILPGFIDAHVHVESSMLVPSEFARLAVVHGTVATVSDPHEIGNVLGVAGVNYMIDNGKQVPFKFYFGAPSCVPATTFETAGAIITAEEIDELMARPEVKYLSEMMNWPGVLFKDEDVYKKLAVAKKHGKPIDGHAPGLMAEQARDYAAAGISTDHECFAIEEALDKLKYGMHIAIREGSAAKNFEALYPLLHDYEDKIMLCSDDKHPDNLVEGHINLLVKRAIENGVDMYKVLKAACINPVRHYSLDVGLLKEGDPADFILVDDLKTWKVTSTYINGREVAKDGKTLISKVKNEIINQFNCDKLSAADFKVKAEGEGIHVIEALDGQLITNDLLLSCHIKDGFAESDIENDVLKFTVINRYRKAKPAIAFIRNFGLKRGAIASTVGHDSHNILVVGVDDEAMAKAANLVIEAKGGVSAYNGQSSQLVPLPVAGLMSEKDGYDVAKAYSAIDKMAKEMGSTLNSPFMTLSFMALLVIPQLKLSDKGLFDGKTFRFTSLFE